MTTSLTDLGTVIAVESLFRHGHIDPWGSRMAGHLADVYAYSDSLRYVLPIPTGENPERFPGQPELLHYLRDEPENFISPEPFWTHFTVTLSDEQLQPAFRKFSAWTKANAPSLRKFLRCHTQGWVREGHDQRVRRPYVYDFDELRATRHPHSLSQRIKVPEDEVLFAFDVALRYSLYGSLAGPRGYYLNHPLRDIPLLPGSEQKALETPICVSFRESVRSMAPGLTQREYVRLLRDLRREVRAYGLHQLKPGQVSQEVVKTIAEKVRLVPFLKGLDKTAGIADGAFQVVGLSGKLASPAGVAGGIAKFASSLWSGRLPRRAASFKWLRWAVRYEVEAQAERRD